MNIAQRIAGFIFAGVILWISIFVTGGDFIPLFGIVIAGVLIIWCLASPKK